MPARPKAIEETERGNQGGRFKDGGNHRRKVDGGDQDDLSDRVAVSSQIVPIEDETVQPFENPPDRRAQDKEPEKRRRSTR